MTKRALITGITGQDGSYLAEFLLEKGYEVHGLVRRLSTANHVRIRHLFDRLSLHDGDLLDQLSLVRTLERVRPAEVYNLAAQSFVPASWNQPVLTGEFTALGVTRMLEAIRAVDPSIRFYQASSSEMFGRVRTDPQNEQTPFWPRSPYGVAKVYGHWITVNYRESYNLFSCSGILFNHETVAAQTPMFVRVEQERGFDIKPISEIVSSDLRADGPPIVDEARPHYQGGRPTRSVQVWDRDGWTRVTFASGYPHQPTKQPKNPRLIQAGCSAIMTTGSHVFILADGQEKPAGRMSVGDQVSLIEFPQISSPAVQRYSAAEAWLIGVCLAKGEILEEGRSAKIAGIKPEISRQLRQLWQSHGGSCLSVGQQIEPERAEQSERAEQLVLSGRDPWLRQLDFYTEGGTASTRMKRVPRAILNASGEVQRAFLEGYYLADQGSSWDPSGGLLSENAPGSVLRTHSATLALGLVYLLQRVTSVAYRIELNGVVDGADGPANSLEYCLCLLPQPAFGEDQESRSTELALAATSQQLRQPIGQSVHQPGPQWESHSAKESAGWPVSFSTRPQEAQQVRQVIELPHYDGWFYDLETESGTFHCGVGQGHVHNSPRRSPEFVTRKITSGAARIALGLSQTLKLGNLHARRDWGFAGDYVQAMWLMLQQETPEDYVIATGLTHSVQDVVEISFARVGLDPTDYVQVDPELFRPAEVHVLRGDASKAHAQLGWQPQVSFEELIAMMVEHDLQLFRQSPDCRSP